MNIHTNFASSTASIILSYIEEDPKDYISYFKTIFSEETLKGIVKSDEIRTICAEQITDYCLDKIYFHFDILTDLFLKCIRGSEYYFLNQREIVEPSTYLYRYSLKRISNAFSAKYHELRTDNFKKFMFDTCGANISTVSSSVKKLSELDCVLICDIHDHPNSRAINSIAALLFSNAKPCVIYTEAEHQTIYRMIDTILLDRDVRFDCWDHDHYSVSKTNVRFHFFTTELLLYGCELISHRQNQSLFKIDCIRFSEFLKRNKDLLTQLGTLSQNVLYHIDDWEYNIKNESMPDESFIQTHFDILISTFQLSHELLKTESNEPFRKRQISLVEKIAKHATTYPGTLPIFLMGKSHAITEESNFEPILGQYLEKHGLGALAISYEIPLLASKQEIANEVPHSYHSHSTGYEMTQSQIALSSYASFLYYYRPIWYSILIDELT